MTGESTRDRAETARAYYRALDGHDYDRLAALLAAGFVHDRPDMTLEGKDRFVQFMREERPASDTRHAIEAIYDARDADGVVAVGRLLDAGGDVLFRFADQFAFEGDSIGRVETFTN
jgi:ketosteroid isomerase-like protein